jgi:glyoxylase I family protein
MPESSTAPSVPKRLHHHAFVTADQEATRRFYEEIIGLPLVAAWTETAAFDGALPQAFCHTFFELGDGAALAFFQFADAELAQRFAIATPADGFHHVALAVDASTQQAIRDRAEAAGIATSVADHGYCRSLYLTDPNGLKLELTVDHPEIATINEVRRRSAPHDLARWLAGDHSTNNDWRREAHLDPAKQLTQKSASPMCR